MKTVNRASAVNALWSAAMLPPHAPFGVVLLVRVDARYGRRDGFIPHPASFHWFDGVTERVGVGLIEVNASFENCAARRGLFLIPQRAHDRYGLARLGADEIAISAGKRIVA